MGGDEEERQATGGPCGQQQGQPVWRKHLTVSPRGGMDRAQLGWGQREPGSRGCCWKLAPRLDPKGALAKKAQMTQTQPLSGRGGSARAPRTATVRGPALSAVLKPGVCGRRAEKARFRRTICAPGPSAEDREPSARRGRLTWRSSARR